jgi:plastocyanin
VLKLITFASIFAALAAVACGTGSDDEGGAASTPARAAATVASTSTPAAAATTAAAGGGTRTIGSISYNDKGTTSAAGKTELPIALENFAFSPTFLQGTPGQKVTLQLTNNSTAPHNITIEAQNVNTDVASMAKGSVEVTIPQTGALLFFCKLHAARGMNGQLLSGTTQPQPLSAAGGAATPAPTQEYGY